MKRADSELLTTEPLDIQRREDEGGQVIENRDLLIHSQPLVHLVAIPARKHAISLPWDKRLVIEPFQPGNGILRENMNGKGKHRE